MKKTTAFLTAVMMIFGTVTALPEDICSGLGTTITANAADVTINATDVQLYALEDGYKEKISIPSNLKQSFKLKVTGASNVTYKVTSGRSVTVSSDGTVTPTSTTYYWYGSYGYSQKKDGVEPDRVTVDYNFGESTITVTAGSKKFTVKATVNSYADLYADQKIDEYIKNNVKSTMSAKEKIEQACKMAASYNYNASYYSSTPMIIMGGGDCWASTELIIRFCKKLGYDAWTRIANKDPGAGSGHRNAMVCADGKYYQADAGYSGKAPRYYSLTERKTLYSYKTVTGGIEVYQYDGHELPETLEIPSTINGKNVVSIGENFAVSRGGMKKVIIPEGVTNIGDSAFNSSEDLEEVVLPSTLQTVGNFVFTNDQKLKKFTVASGNKYFSSKNGVLYDKKKTALICCPAAATVTIPSTVKTISDYAFYYNKQIEKIVIPDSVTETGEAAFANCPALKFVTFGKNIKKIGRYSFFDSTEVKDIEIPASVASIGDYGVGFSYSDTKTPVFTMYVTEGSYAHTYAVENELNFKFGSKPQKGAVSGTITIHSTSVNYYYYTSPEMSAINSKGETIKINNSYDNYLVILEPGDYTIVAKKSGYGTVKRKVKVTNEQTAALDIDLWKLGDVNQDDEVSLLDVVCLSRAVSGVESFKKYLVSENSFDSNDEISRLDVVLLSRRVSQGFWS